MSTPLVGLACVREDIDGVPYPAVSQPYVSALEEVAGCAVALLPGPGPLPPEVLARFDGILLGGHESNVAPERYAGRPGPGTRAPERDELALNLIPSAIRYGLPLLGVCRGLQELNVAFGGTLRDLTDAGGVQHREDVSLPRDRQYLPQHDVAVTPGGRLHRVLGRDRVRVNSLHRQGVDRLADGLRAEARADDGLVEAVSVAGAESFALAVQWHPEWYAALDEHSERLFAAFGDAARAHARSRGTSGGGGA